MDKNTVNSKNKVQSQSSKEKISKKEKELRLGIVNKLSRYFGTTPEEANKDQIYKSVILSVKDILSNKRTEFKKNVKNHEAKKIYYICMEFLIGKSLKNNLMNLGICDEYTKILKDMGYDINELYDMEMNAGLGNGGLGRLAACFMDSLTTLNYSATGFSILYEYGIFKQKIIVCIS